VPQLALSKHVCGKAIRRKAQSSRMGRASYTGSRRTSKVQKMGSFEFPVGQAA
jgi:hypothetical protein